MSGRNLNEELFAPLKSYTETRRILIAYSGGLDSRVLLHLAAENRNSLACEIEAIHIDHGLHSESADWAEHCVQTCQSQSIKCHVLKANLLPQIGESIEAVARNKRYELFESLMQKHDLLLLAQHADDQAETVLLQLLRGAGPMGLSAMPYSREFADGFLIRPLLQFSRAELEAYATNHQLNWIEDPSNADDRYDRNYLRQLVFPLIESRFPGYRKTFARSARHCAELVANTAVHADNNYLACLKQGSDVLSIKVLKGLSQNSQKQVLRSWIKNLGYQVPQSHQLSLMLRAFFSDTPDRFAAVATSNYQVRRYQDGLYLLEGLVEISAFNHLWTNITKPLQVPELDLELNQQAILRLGLKLDPTKPASVRSRQGNEKLCTDVNRPRKSIKSLFQEQAIPWWERDKYPFIYQNDKLVAVLGLAVDHEFRMVGVQALNTQTEVNTADS